MNALRASTVAELRAALPTEAHRLLFDHFEILSGGESHDITQGVASPDPVGPSVETQRLEDLRAITKRNRQSLAEALHLTPEAGWPAIIGCARARVAMLASLEDAIGIDTEDLDAYLAEVASLCRAGRAARERERSGDSNAPLATSFDPWDLGITARATGDILLALASGEDPERVAEATFVLSPVVRQVGERYTEILDRLKSEPEKARASLVTTWSEYWDARQVARGVGGIDWDSGHLATIPGPNECGGHPPETRCVVAEIKIDPPKSSTVPKGSPLTPWTLDCTPDQAQLACQLFAQGKRVVEVAAGADVSKETAAKIHGLAQDLITGLKSKPESEWPPILAKRVARWNLRVALRDAEGASAN